MDINLINNLFGFITSFLIAVYFYKNKRELAHDICKRDVFNNHFKNEIRVIEIILAILASLVFCVSVIFLYRLLFSYF